MNFKQAVSALTYIKEQGVSRESALDLLEIEGDQEPDPIMLNEALEDVYGSSSDRMSDPMYLAKAHAENED